MEYLLVLVVGGAAAAAVTVRHSIPGALAKRILVLSALGTVASGIALFLLLTGRFSLLHPYVWAWVLAAVFLLSLGAAPFGLFAILTRRESGAQEGPGD